MEVKEKNSIFIQNGTKNYRIMVFFEKIKRHLSDELLYLTDRKDDYENQIMQLRAEKEQKGRTLFPNVDKKDVRKYFSPLNLKEIAEDQKDEKQRQLQADMERIQLEIGKIDNRISEIKQFLFDIEELMTDNFDGDSLSDGENEDAVAFGLKK